MMAYSWGFDVAYAILPHLWVAWKNHSGPAAHYRPCAEDCGLRGFCWASCLELFGGSCFEQSSSSPCSSRCLFYWPQHALSTSHPHPLVQACSMGPCVCYATAQFLSAQLFWSQRHGCHYASGALLAPGKRHLFPRMARHVISQPLQIQMRRHRTSLPRLPRRKRHMHQVDKRRWSPWLG